jgi:general secretion pathway protein G
MLAVKPSQFARVRHSAFTLVEVMVVMAIIVILASLATVGTMRYLNNAKELTDEARATQIVKAYLTEFNRSGGDVWPEDPSMVATYLDKGTSDLVNPWNVPYQVTIEDTESGPKPYVISSRPDGTTQRYPRR